MGCELVQKKKKKEDLAPIGIKELLLAKDITNMCYTNVFGHLVIQRECFSCMVIIQIAVLSLYWNTRVLAEINRMQV